MPRFDQGNFWIWNMTGISSYEIRFLPYQLRCWVFHLTSQAMYLQRYIVRLSHNFYISSTILTAWCLITRRALLWWFNVAGYNKTLCILPVIFARFYPNLTTSRNKNCLLTSPLQPTKPRRPRQSWSCSLSLRYTPHIAILLHQSHIWRS